MPIRRKLFAVILSLVLLFSTAGSVCASNTQEADRYIQQILNYYRYHQSSAATDIDCLFYQLSQVNPYKAQDWSSIMDYWNYVNTDMTVYPDVLPDGLPQDDTLCIVVMGYALNSDGSMRRELIGRLETAYASAQKYPNAYIVCTGGGTAQNNKSRTEAGQMSKWLINKGIDSKRIIIEDQSLSTVANAINTCRILANEYPLVTHLAIVTSDYHLARSCLLFHTQATLSASKGAPLLCVAANAAYPIPHATPESIAIQADNLSQLTGISINGLPKPKLSKLDHINVWDDIQYTPGSELELQVIAHYDTGLYRDVSKFSEHTGIDPAASGIQDVTVTYKEGDIAVSTTLQIDIPVPETAAPTEPPASETAAPTEAALPETLPQPIEPQSPAAPQHSQIPVQAVIAAALLLVALPHIKRFLTIRKRKKAEKNAAKEEHIDLPDDDSPVEYI